MPFLCQRSTVALDFTPAVQIVQEQLWCAGATSEVAPAQLNGRRAIRSPTVACLDIFTPAVQIVQEQLWCAGATSEVAPAQ